MHCMYVGVWHHTLAAAQYARTPHSLGGQLKLNHLFDAALCPKLPREAVQGGIVAGYSVRCCRRIDESIARCLRHCALGDFGDIDVGVACVWEITLFKTNWVHLIFGVVMHPSRLGFE